MLDLISIRRYLHQNPELSNHEFQTADFVEKQLSELSAHPKIVRAGKTGIVATFGSSVGGKHLLFRCELDALPIMEVNQFEHKSLVDGVSHKCGHDGHMTILLGLAQKLSANPINRGTVTLLFQPAEETGDGAREVMNTKILHRLNPDFAFALHNVPGYPLGAGIVKDGPFNAAVKTMVINYYGKTSHAAEPENGINPALAIANTLLFAKTIEQPDTARQDFQLAVPVHTVLGEEANGISAGYGKVHLTLRSWTTNQMQKMEDRLSKEVKQVAMECGLEHEIGFEESFEASSNTAAAVDYIRRSAVRHDIAIIEKNEPFKWGEDFGLITAAFPGAMFGLGAGEKCPALHNPDYDFPDELITTGVNLFYGIIEETGLADG